KQFENELGRQLVSFTTQRLLAMLKANGALQTAPGTMPHVHPGSLHATHLAMEPSREAISALTAEVLRALTDDGQLKPGVEALELRPNVLERGLWSLQAVLGGERPTF